MSIENQNSATDFTRLFHNYKRDEDFIQHAFSTSATSHFIVWDRTKQLKNGQPFGLQFQNPFLALPTFPVRTYSCSNSLFFPSQNFLLFLLLLLSLALLGFILKRKWFFSEKQKNVAVTYKKTNKTTTVDCETRLS